MTCWSCRFGEYAAGACWCVKWRRIVLARCEAFEYEPGTDETERGR